MFLRHIEPRRAVQKPPRPQPDSCGFRRMHELRAPSHHWRPDHVYCWSPSFASFLSYGGTRRSPSPVCGVRD